MEATKLKIVSQGAAKVSGLVVVVAKTRKLVALDVPMESKYCRVNASVGGDEPGISICTTDESYNLNTDYEGYEDTIISFPEYKGWEHFADSSGRYNIQVCLIKRKIV